MTKNAVCQLSLVAFSPIDKMKTRRMLNLKQGLDMTASLAWDHYRGRCVIALFGITNSYTSMLHTTDVISSLNFRPKVFPFDICLNRVCV